VLAAQSMRAETPEPGDPTEHWAPDRCGVTAKLVTCLPPVDASKPLADRDAARGSYMQASNSVRVFASVIGTGLPPAEGSSRAIVVSSSRRW